MCIWEEKKEHILKTRLGYEWFEDPFFLIPYFLDLPHNVVGRISPALPALAAAEEKSLLFYLWHHVTDISPFKNGT